MDFRHHPLPLRELPAFEADALLIAVHGPAKELGLPKPLATLLEEAIEQGDFDVKGGRSLYLHRPAGVKAQRVLFVGAGSASAKALRGAVNKAVAAVKELGVKHVAVAAAGFGALEAAHAEAAVLAAADALYVYRHTKPSAPKPGSLRKLTLLSSADEAPAVAAGLSRAVAIAEGVTLAREYANRPGNHCRPRDLADAAKDLGKQFKLKVEVFDRAGIEKIGMGSFLSVTRGSEEPPRFIVLRYEGAAKSQAPVVLVGKGITFDTGGISLKPAPEMDEMKFDMGGAASVLGTFRAIAQLKPKINLVGLIPTCENMPDGRATKPGDVVTSLSGQTIEVLNTDAEGRLILCDALTYAERFKPQAVVDIATLTGACVIALGNLRSGLFSPDDELAAALLAAGEAAQDGAWRMPLDEEYEEGLKSNFADVGNVGGRAGGAITAAMFLKRFTKAYRWAHLDIAGTAWKSGGAKGGTGRPVGLLTHFVLSQVGQGEAAAAPGKAPARKRSRA
ncbi:MAG: leucyl aminopeptidase [Aquabacterium sp.]|jgi:leucyl aminopeptidase|nr:MAG: leucyl aminopeptidase [Aquabacterium sp.]